MPTPYEAGRELDAMIAKAFGWRTRPASRRYAQREGWFPQGSNYVHALPAFSTDIAAAFSIVEAMRAKGWQVSIHLCETPPRPSDPAPVVISMFRLKPEPNPEREIATACGWADHVKADALPLAICLAALNALATASPAKASVPDSHSGEAGR